MSTESPRTDALATNALIRKPRQGRSHASFERMLAATKMLMLERKGEDFTLQEVSERGNVSIGSIYLRFESKDRLLHAVIARELQAIIAAERVMIDNILAESATLGQFLERYIDRYSGFLEKHAALLRTIMQRAAVDPAVSGAGNETAQRASSMSVDAIMTFVNEIRGDDAVEKAEAVYRIIFAVIARQFGLGASLEPGNDRDWSMIKRHMAKMALAHLRYSS